MPTPSSESDDQAALDACHDLLVRLAGRLPDELLWRLRDWLASGGLPALARTLPKALLRYRVGLTEAERSLLINGLGHWGAQRRLLDAVLLLSEPEAPEVEFDPVDETGAECDLLDLVLMAVVSGHSGAIELRRAWRIDAGQLRRVVLVQCTADLPTLTGTLQRVLRAHGHASPCVEVLSPQLGLPPYHRLALANSVQVWRSENGPIDEARKSSRSAASGAPQATALVGR